MKPGLAAFAVLAVEQQVLDFLRKIFERRAEVDAVSVGHDLQLVDQILRRRARAQPAFEQRLRPVGDHLRGIEVVVAAQAVALRAGAIGAVEGERARLQLRHVDAAVGAGQPLANKAALRRRLPRPAPGRLPASSPGRRKFEAVLNPGLHQQAVDDDFDGVVFALVELEVFFEIHQFAVHAGAGESVLGQLLQSLS